MSETEQQEQDDTFLEQSEINPSDSYQDVLIKIIRKKVPKAFEGE